MANRHFVGYKESLASFTTNSGAYQFVDSINFLPDSGASYIIGFTCGGLSTSTSSTFDVIIYEELGGTSLTFPAPAYIPHDATNVGSYGSFYIYTDAGFRETFSVYVKRGSGGSVTMTDLRIFAFKIGANDYSDIANLSTTSTTPQDVSSITLTNAGDYLVMAYATCHHNNTGTEGVIQLDHEGTVYNLMQYQVGNTADSRPWFAVKKITASASDVVKVQIYSLTANTTDVDGDCVVYAFALNTIDNNYSASDLTRTTTNSLTYVDKLTLTQTPLAGEHMVIYNAISDASANSITNVTQGLQDSTAKTEAQVEPWLGSGNDMYSYCTIARETLAASSTTWKIQHHKKAGVGIVGTDEAFIGVVQMDGTNNVNILGNTNILGKTNIL